MAEEKTKVHKTAPLKKIQGGGLFSAGKVREKGVINALRLFSCAAASP